MDTHVLLALFHIFLVVPLFLYVAISKTETHVNVYRFMLILGAIVFVYHAYKSLLRYSSGSSMLWVNLLHVLYVAPLMIYIGYKEKNTPRSSYELLALIGFGALGYHLYNLVISINITKSLTD